jgi:hypothetical protein
MSLITDCYGVYSDEVAVFAPLNLDSDRCPVPAVDGRDAAGIVGGSNCTSLRGYSMADLVRAADDACS